jgi:hypothetical protein
MRKSVKKGQGVRPNRPLVFILVFWLIIFVILREINAYEMSIHNVSDSFSNFYFPLEKAMELIVEKIAKN